MITIFHTHTGSPYAVLRSGYAPLRPLLVHTSTLLFVRDMRTFIALCSALLLGSVHCQTYVNPFLNNANRFNHQDIIILWNEPGTSSVNQQLFGFDWIAQAGGQTDVVEPLLSLQPMADVDMSGGRYINSHALRANPDAADDIFYLFETANAWRCGIGGIDSEFIDLDSTFSNQLQPPASYLDIPIAGTTGPPRTVIADLDGDGTEEVAVAWWESTSDLIHIQILDTDNGLDPQLRASISDQASVRINNQYHAYDIGAADLNGDGAEELILTGIEMSGSGNAIYQVFTKVYEVNNTGSNSITPKAYLVIDDQYLVDDDLNGYQLGYAQTAVTGIRTTADTLADQPEHIFASFAFCYYGDPIINYDNFFHYLISASADLNTLLITDATPEQLSSSNFKPEYPLQAGAADINGDLVEDVVIITSTCHLYAVENEAIAPKGMLGSVQLDENNSGILESVDRLEFGDVDQDGRYEFITFSKSHDGEGQHTFLIGINGVDAEFNSESGGSYTFNDQDDDALRSYSIAVGNLDGRDMHFGDPHVLQCNYVQPVFLIGAIPNHFDVINGIQYDVNDCYPVQDCDQDVTIRQSQTGSTTAEVQFTADWAVSTEAELGFEGGGFSMGTTISEKYGVKFDQVNTQTNTQTITIAITASADDMVEYVQIPVTVHKYPVLSAIDDTICWVLSVFPSDNFSPQTIVANGKSLFNYTPDHEVGNIMSYPVISDNYDNVPGVPQTYGTWIIDNGNIPIYTMSPSGGITYTLNQTEHLAWSEATTSYAAVNTGISTLGFGIGLPEDQDGTDFLEAEGLPSNFPPNAIDMSQLRLYSNSISTETQFEITPTNIIGSPNEFNYLIGPKIYWNTDGAGTVFFEVDIDEQPGSGSFWSQAYTALPDPALNMPYRYEQVINPDLTNTFNLDRTRSMRFSTLAPQPGDTVSLFLRVFNYSLEESGMPIEFDLHHGHPDQGGIPIAAVDGTTTFQTSGPLAARAREEVEVRFIATPAMVSEDFVKIYARLDPDDLIEEIHDGNNLGWAQFGYACNTPGTIVGLEEIGPTNETDRLKIHPVPASDQVIIDHDMRGSRSALAFILVRNMISEEVARFPISTVYSGQVFWNTRAIPAGMYAIGLYDEHGLRSSGKALITR